MSSWWDAIKKEAKSNTIKNPLDTLFPNARKPEQKVVVPSPLKEKAKETYTDKITDIKDNIVDKVTDIKAKTTPIIFFGVIAFIVYNLAKDK